VSSGYSGYLMPKLTTHNFSADFTHNITDGCKSYWNDAHFIPVLYEVVSQKQIVSDSGLNIHVWNHRY